MASDGKWSQVIASDVTRCGGYGGQQRKARSTGPPTGNPYKALAPPTEVAPCTSKITSQAQAKGPMVITNEEVSLQQLRMTSMTSM